MFLLTAKSPTQFPPDRRTGGLQWRPFVRVSKSLEEILDRLLRISLQERYRSAKDVLADLNRTVQSPVCDQPVPDDFQQFQHCLVSQPLTAPKPGNQTSVQKSVKSRPTKIQGTAQPSPRQSPYARLAESIRNRRARHDAKY